MPVEFPNRIHGDGRLIINPSFNAPLRKNESQQYLNALTHILGEAAISLTINPADPQLPSTLLALKQRFMIGFSNGCPWPEKVIKNHLLKQEKPPTSLNELAQEITKSGLADGRNNMLYQILLQNGSDSLKDELLSYHPWSHIEGQEDRNLPKDITDENGRGGYSLAYDPPYFDALIPLYKYIDNGAEGTHDARYFAVMEFFEKTAGKMKSIQELVKKTEGFLSNPSAYLKPFLPKNK